MRRGDEGSEKGGRGPDSPRSQDAVSCGGGTGATENDEHRGAAASARWRNRPWPRPGSPRVVFFALIPYRVL